MNHSKFGQLIGKGAFSKVYKKDCEDFVTIISSDPVKEAFALDLSEDNPLFTPLQRIEYDDNGLGYYRQKYLGKTSGKITEMHPRHQKLYRILRNHPYMLNTKNTYSILYNFFESIGLANPDLENEVYALQDMLNCVANYTNNIGFEISPRNIRIIDGNLILIDCFFCRDHLQNTFKKKSKKLYYW